MPTYPPVASANSGLIDITGGVRFLDPEEAIDLASSLLSAANEANGYPKITAATQAESGAGRFA